MSPSQPDAEKVYFMIRIGELNKEKALPRWRVATGFRTKAFSL